MLPQSLCEIMAQISHYKLQVGHSIVLGHLQVNEMSFSKVATITKGNIGSLFWRTLCTYGGYHYSPKHSRCLELFQN